ncbi:PREDICTED: trichohyalin-like [Habropoda laboriosa]|uniref:trichohyalin-like n=1 Tax=Habropoda laboriosa TaxID=597456 RepID=UPI00083CE243|nr:PREDICTED: trichohyalin-like [Habropoda laboriosa]
MTELRDLVIEKRVPVIFTVDISKSSVEIETPEDSQQTKHEVTSCGEKKEAQSAELEKGEAEAPKEEKVDIKRKRREERLAKEKQAEEERERFVKEAAERKAAEREEIIKQAKRLILYRKPMCRRINQGLLISECFRELDAQLKFRETIKSLDKEAEVAYVDLLKADVKRYEEEMKQKAEQRLEKRKNYGLELKKQIEEIGNARAAKELEEFESEKQDQINMNKYLQDVKEHEAEQLLTKKQKLKQFFKGAIEEKKQFDLMLKREEEFEDRANEIYRNTKARIQKIHKEVKLKEKQEKEQKARQITEQQYSQLQSALPMEEKILKKAQEEQEAQYQEKQRKREERKLQFRKEVNDIQMETSVAKSKQLREEKDVKTWETVQRFKRAEWDKEMEAEERKQEWKKRIEYGNMLKKYISERETVRKEEQIADEEMANMTKIMEIENRRILNYAEEILNESKGVRPLFPILKAVEECKKEMGLIVPKKKGETIDTKPKRRRVPRVCTKYVPEEKILYL